MEGGGRCDDMITSFKVGGGRKEGERCDDMITFFNVATA